MYPIKYINEDLNLGYALTSSGRNVISFNPHENNFDNHCLNLGSGKTLKAFNEEVQESIDKVRVKSEGNPHDENKKISHEQVVRKIMILIELYKAVNNYFDKLAYLKEARVHLSKDDKYIKLKKERKKEGNINNNKSEQNFQDPKDKSLSDKTNDIFEKIRTPLVKIFHECGIILYLPVKHFNHILVEKMLKFQDEINKELKVLGEPQINGIEDLDYCLTNIKEVSKKILLF